MKLHELINQGAKFGRQGHLRKKATVEELIKFYNK